MTTVREALTAYGWYSARWVGGGAFASGFGVVLWVFWKNPFLGTVVGACGGLVLILGILRVAKATRKVGPDPRP